ncbi:MAG: tryptophan halogenase family protein [Xanthomonadales bacterium]|nr:tryptophan halogenase family protein [Xanthomonadales bacterium]
MRIRNIVIVGGGTAGWMVAAAFSQFSKSGLANVTLVESADIGVVGVGEATIPPFLGFNKLIGVDEADMMAAVGGTFKLGIQFVNWLKQGDSYFHPFGNYGYEIEGVPFHQIWHKLRKNGDPRPLYLYNVETIAAQFGKFAISNPNARADLPPVNYAYHLDAVKYGQYLRTFSKARGVKRIEGLIEDTALDPESGFVKSVTLKDGQTVEGDFFIDCSGFRGLLIEQALETGYEDWTHWLPCDRAWAVQSDQPGDPLPYTRATAHAAGWQWRVPLQHRLGNGHVFCSRFMSDDDALKILLANLDGEPTSEPRLLRFVTGHRKKFWNRNVVAIGLSSGFMEPLESTSIHLIHSAINKLMLIFSLAGVEPQQERIFNRLALKEFRRIRDFLILHYNATARDDSEFWNYCRTMDVPETLTEKVELFKFNGQIFREEDELFTATSWAAVMLGQGIQPGVYSPLVDALDQDSLLKEVGEMEKSVKYVVYHMPKHKQFLDRYCPASVPA